MMRKFLYISVIIALIFTGCSPKETGELQGVAGRPTNYFEPDPYGMVFIPGGSFNMGPSDQDIAYTFNSQTKTVSIDPFWMDETEITNNEYRQFVYWVRDSIARGLLGSQDPEFLISEDANGNPIAPPFLNWEKEIDWNDPTNAPILEKMFYSQEERFYRRKEIDPRELNYSYSWIDLRQAAKKTNRYNTEEKKYDGEIIDNNAVRKPIKDRSSFIMKNSVNIYPDTLVWMSDYTYSYNEPWAKSYFWHPAFDEYPVVGVTWVQASAFCIWRTELLNNYLAKNGQSFVQDYRLPTEAEWEYAARGDLDLAPYPWGGPYTRNNKGCFIANFKPLRGNYGSDGGIRTLAVAMYAPNGYGLYDMAGNVAEWTSNAYDESSYSFTHDLNPDYTYNALKSDPEVLKRKVIRGGSWKDIAYYLQTGTRTYEYQDTAKCYLGFRCVRSFMGRDIFDYGGSGGIK
jgi:gliding motility-associated lipoprotein GldK